MKTLLVREQQIVAAMQFHEKKFIAANGPLDGVNLPPDVSNLADLLGLMWFEKFKDATVQSTSKIAALLLESGQTLSEI